MKKSLENFTIQLAIVDLIPVLLFSGSIYLISIIFNHSLFLIGALLCIIAGLLKVSWKFIIVLCKKDIHILNKQMRILMPLGFIIMIISCIIYHKDIHFKEMITSFLSFPSVIFFIIGIFGMCMMTYFAKHLDGTDAKSNWIEQLTNAFAQACFFLGLLFIVL